ncbi:MAG: rod shape-determining protein [Eubacteriales bacterium]|nr:rod shape-determining protein [Eubacteriales bacterium]
MATNCNIGIDIGGSGIRMAVRKSGIVFQESALAAFRPGKAEYVALGDEARVLRGREPLGIRTGAPLEGGRVSIEALLDMWLPKLLKIAQAEGAGRPHVMLVGGPNAREADLQAVRGAILRAGGAGMAVLEAEFAAALGAWMPEDAGKEEGPQADVMEHEGTMVVDVGAYSAFSAMISGGRIVRRDAVGYGLQGALDALRAALRTEYALAAGMNTVEEAFRTLAALEEDRDVPPIEVSGLHLERQLPATVLLRAQSVRTALRPYAEAAGRLAAATLLHAPEELAADIHARGILLTGGGARLPMVRKAVEDATGVRCRVSAEPEAAAIRGTMRVMNAPGRFGELPLEAGV